MYLSPVGDTVGVRSAVGPTPAVPTSSRSDKGDAAIVVSRAVGVYAPNRDCPWSAMRLSFIMPGMSHAPVASLVRPAVPLDLTGDA